MKVFALVALYFAISFQITNAMNGSKELEPHVIPNYNGKLRALTPEELAKDEAEKKKLIEDWVSLKRDGYEFSGSVSDQSNLSTSFGSVDSISSIYFCSCETIPEEENTKKH